jgi:hypothetical protein
MRWFDDPWLKEGFAQYMAYEILATLYRPGDIWKGFYQSFKPAAYTIDSTHGTAPIHQSIANLKGARPAYGAIVYSKTPGILRQLSFDAQRAASPELEAMLESRMQSAPDLSLRILYCRSFRSIATTPAALARLKSLLAGQSSVPGLEIKPLDRWTMIAASLAHADPDASALLHAEQQVTPSATAASTHTRPARPVPTPPSNSNTSRITWRTVRYRKTGLSRVSPLSTTGPSRL